MSCRLFHRPPTSSLSTRRVGGTNKPDTERVYEKETATQKDQPSSIATKTGKGKAEIVHLIRNRKESDADWASRIASIFGSDEPDEETGFSPQELLIRRLCGSTGIEGIPLSYALSSWAKADGICVAKIPGGIGSTEWGGFLSYLIPTSVDLVIDLICSKGYGRQLMEFVEAFAKEQNYAGLTLSALPDPVGFYRSLGFRNSLGCTEDADITALASQMDWRATGADKRKPFYNLLVEKGLTSKPCTSIQSCDQRGYRMTKCLDSSRPPSVPLKKPALATLLSVGQRSFSQAVQPLSAQSWADEKFRIDWVKRDVIGLPAWKLLFFRASNDKLLNPAFGLMLLDRAASGLQWDPEFHRPQLLNQTGAFFLYSDSELRGVVLYRLQIGPLVVSTSAEILYAVAPDGTYQALFDRMRDDLHAQKTRRITVRVGCKQVLLYRMLNFRFLLPTELTESKNITGLCDALPQDDLTSETAVWFLAPWSALIKVLSTNGMFTPGPLRYDELSTLHSLLMTLVL